MPSLHREGIIELSARQTRIAEGKHERLTWRERAEFLTTSDQIGLCAVSRSKPKFQGYLARACGGDRVVGRMRLG